MKKLLLIPVCLLLFVGCNESKEGRIQKLESEAEQSARKFDELENRVQALEGRIENRSDKP